MWVYVCVWIVESARTLVGGGRAGYRRRGCVAVVQTAVISVAVSADEISGSASGFSGAARRVRLARAAARLFVIIIVITTTFYIHAHRRVFKNRRPSVSTIKIFFKKTVTRTSSRSSWTCLSRGARARDGFRDAACGLVVTAAAEECVVDECARRTVTSCGAPERRRTGYVYIR